MSPHEREVFEHWLSSHASPEELSLGPDEQMKRHIQWLATRPNCVIQPTAGPTPGENYH